MPDSPKNKLRTVSVLVPEATFRAAKKAMAGADEKMTGVIIRLLAQYARDHGEDPDAEKTEGLSLTPKRKAGGR